MDVRIRKAVPEDAVSIARVLGIVAAERVYSAILEPWPADRQRAYLESLSDREAFFLAEDAETGVVIGYQSLDAYSAVLPAMRHVATVGTFLLPDWRGRGVGTALWRATAYFARATGYTKIVIQVRGSNFGAQTFYRSVGFLDCGRLRDQVIIEGKPDDEVVMELFL